MAGSTVWSHSPPQAKAGGTLFARMGGEPKLKDWVYGFYDRMLADKEVAPLLLKSQGAQAQAVYMKLIKDRTIEYLECVWGGDQWEGQDMFRLHAMLHINDVVYDRAIKCGAAQLKQMRVSKDVHKDVMVELEIMREPITDPGGKLHKWIMDKQAAMEKKGEEEQGTIKGAMGFTISAAQMKQMAAEAHRREDMKVRLAAERQKRLDREKAERKAAKAKAEETTTPKAEESMTPSTPTTAKSDTEKAERKAAKAKADETNTPKAEEAMTPSTPTTAKSAERKAAKAKAEETTTPKAEESLTPSTPTTAKSPKAPKSAKPAQSAVQNKDSDKAASDSNGKAGEVKVAAKVNTTTKKSKSEQPESPCTTASTTGGSAQSSFEKTEDGQVALSKALETSKSDQEVSLPPLPMEESFTCLQDSTPMPLPGGVSKLI